MVKSLFSNGTFTSDGYRVGKTVSYTLDHRLWTIVYGPYSMVDKQWSLIFTVRYMNSQWNLRKAGVPITEENYQFHVDIDYNYGKRIWLETRKEFWSRTQEINRNDWANSSAWRSFAEFPIFHDYLMFDLVFYV